MSLVTVRIRPAGVLGDQSDATYTSALGPIPGLPAVGTLAVTAASLVVPPEAGPIVSLTFYARVRVIGDGVLSGSRLTWTLATVEQTQAVPSFNGSFAEFSSGTVLTDPSGGAWSWADVAALTSIGAELDFVLNGAELVQLSLDAAEVYVDVIYVPFVVVPVTLASGPLSAELAGGNRTLGLVSGPAGLSLDAASVVAVGLVSGPHAAIVEE